MPKRKTEKKVWWICKICSRQYSDKPNALNCENQAPYKAKLRGEKGYSDSWKIGDFCDISIFERGHCLALIIGTKQIQHTIIPIFEFINTGIEDYDYSKHEEVIILDSSMKERIIRWANAFSDNPSRRKP